jgi:hypothetical protein
MPEEPQATPPSKSKDEVALELMKFIAVTTGYGKGGSSAGYGAKPTRSPEEYADALLELFQRCRGVVNQ